jgi:hypothetical protein
MQMTILENAIKAATCGLEAYYKLTASIDHNGEKGGFREYFVNQMIRPLLPVHFGLSSGIIMDRNGRQSRQCDVIVYDTRLMPPILRTEGRGVFPIDCVLYVIEVKSKLSSSHLAEAAESASRISARYLADNTENLSGMEILNPGRTPDKIVTYPLYSIFAFETDADKKDEYERLFEQAPEMARFIRNICVLSKGNWIQTSSGILRNLSQDTYINAKDFLLTTFDIIETIALQRNHFRLRDWVSISESFQSVSQ